MSEADALLPEAKVASRLGALLRQWRGQVERLAREFLRGEAQVDPLVDACRRCHLQGCLPARRARRGANR